MQLTARILRGIQLLEMARDCPSSIAYPERIDSLRQLLASLLKANKTIPRSLFVKGISLKSNIAIKCGGFADIFQGSYRGELVALKRMRISSNDQDMENAIDVSTHIWS